MVWKIFDGHNDILLRLLQAPERREAIWLTGEGKGHLDLPRMRAGGFAAGFFAIYVPSPVAHDAPDYMALMDSPPYALPLPELMGHEAAQPVAHAMAAHLLWMERSSQGAFKVCRTLAEVKDCLATGVIAGILHMEGAEAIDEGLEALHTFHALGLRSLGPVWSRPTIFGHGVPFRFPGDPDTGPGLTDAGKRLVAECNRLGIMLDLSHLNEAGFNDVAALSDAPLVATHSNAWAITPSTRNLTDRQLAVIRESRGMVGLNFATVFLRADGRQSPDMGWDPILRHLDHLLDRLGEDHLGFGSDFDGATLPDGIGDVTGLPNLTAAMEAHGYGGALMEKLTCANWVGLLERTWK
ncbi:MAG: dipeptidase [Gemmobacter sp.]|jgi:membrane dipeptidase|nr:dipeptidase [Gemmobacter sp.]